MAQFRLVNNYRCFTGSACLHFQVIFGPLGHWIWGQQAPVTQRWLFTSRDSCLARILESSYFILESSYFILESSYFQYCSTDSRFNLRLSWWRNSVNCSFWRRCPYHIYFRNVRSKLSFEAENILCLYFEANQLPSLLEFKL